MKKNYNYELINNEIELLWAKPPSDDLYPCLLFIHGHNQERVGAQMHTNFLKSIKRLERWGVVIASVSQLGYGHSKGAPDYCGPKTQEGVIAALDFLKNKDFINSNKIVLIGYSRGAIVASMIQVKYPGLAAIILGAGFYDFQQYYNDSSSEIKKSILRESGVDEESCRQRSVLSHTEELNVPTLILHGAKDERKGLKGARLLLESLSRRSVPSKLNIYENYGHHIPFKVFFKESIEFLKTQLIIK